jgi:thiol:disulfide interchange protein DsbD
LLALALGLVPWVLAEDEFLEPDQAFRLSAEAAGADALQVRWEIAEGYYLYQSKLGFQSTTAGISIGDPGLPAAETKEDEFVERSPGAPNRLTLEARSQGCADAGLCYPPQRQQLQIELPVLAVAAPTIETTAAQASPAVPSALGQSLGLGMEEDILPV